jgi:hypothetical protein
MSSNSTWFNAIALAVTISAAMTCLFSLLALFSLLFRDGGYSIAYEIPEEAMVALEVSKMAAMAVFGFVFVTSALAAYLAFTHTTLFLRLQMMLQE